jgi:hypothetical protein
MIILLSNSRNQDESTERERYLASIVVLLTAACILLFQFQEVAGRLLYFANPFVTILIAGVFFQRVVARPLYSIKALIYFLGVLSYGWFVLVYPSTARQLGV